MSLEYGRRTGSVSRLTLFMLLSMTLPEMPPNTYWPHFHLPRLPPKLKLMFTAAADAAILNFDGNNLQVDRKNGEKVVENR